MAAGVQSGVVAGLVPPGAIVGRQAELGEFGTILDAALAGRGGCVAVVGEGGIGKTRLCEAFADLAVSRGAAVAWSACWDRDAPPFTPWTQLLAQLDGAGLPVEPPVTADPAMARSAMFSDVVGRLQAAAAQQPRLLVVDDIHWADEPTAHLLARVLPAIRGMAAVLVVCVRDDELRTHPAAGFADHVMRHARVQALPLLGPEEVGQLVSAQHGPVAATRAYRLWELTAGNPLFARELAAWAASAPTTALEHADVSLPVSLRQVLVDRLRRVADVDRDVIDIVAVLADHATPTLVSDVTGRSSGDVDRALQHAASGGILLAGPVGHVFSHPLLRTALLDELPVARRTELAGRAATALLAARDQGMDVDAATIARHLLDAVADGDAALAVTWGLRAAAEAMTRLAYESASAMLARCLAVVAAMPAAGDRAMILLQLGDAEAAAGQTERAEAAFGEAAEAARQAGRPDLLADAVLGLTGGTGFEIPIGDPDDAELLRDALDRLGDGDPARRARMLARLSVVQTLLVPVAARRALADEALTMARQVDLPAIRAEALAAVCDTSAGPEHVEVRAQAASEIVQLGQEAGDLAVELLGLRLRLVARLEAGELDGVDADIDRYSVVVQRLGHAAYTWYVPLWRGMRDLMRGDLSTRRRHRNRLAELVEQSGSANAHLLLLAQDLMADMQAGGDLTAHQQELARFADEEEEAALGVQFKITQALVAALVGDHDRASALLRRWAAALRAAEPDSEWLPMLVQAAECLVLLPARDPELDLAAWLHGHLVAHADRFAVEGIGAYVHGAAAGPAAKLAGLLGCSDEATELMEQAARAEEEAGAVALAARTRLQATELPSPSGPPAGGGTEPASTGREGVFRREGDHWRLEFAGASASVRDSKGMRDLAALLAVPGRGLAALDLMASGAAVGTTAFGRDQMVTAKPGDLGPVLDDTARAAYRHRVEEIEEELDAADRHGDAERSSHLLAERDALLAELASAYGLGGRPRREGDPAERARSAVTARIRDAVRRIDAVHPALGSHLRHAVRTGAICTYDPEQPVRWQT